MTRRFFLSKTWWGSLVPSSLPFLSPPLSSPSPFYLPLPSPPFPKTPMEWNSSGVWEKAQPPTQLVYFNLGKSRMNADSYKRTKNMIKIHITNFYNSTKLGEALQQNVTYGTERWCITPDPSRPLDRAQINAYDGDSISVWYYSQISHTTPNVHTYSMWLTTTAECYKKSRRFRQNSQI